MSIMKSKTNLSGFRSPLDDFWNSEKLFSNEMFNYSFPAVNIRENETDFEIELASPGFEKKDFKVHAENGILNIKAEKKKESEEKEKAYTRKEFSYESFERRFSIPVNTSDEKVSATYENGILKIKIEKDLKAISAKKEIPVQ